MLSFVSTISFSVEDEFVSSRKVQKRHNFVDILLRFVSVIKMLKMLAIFYLNFMQFAEQSWQLGLLINFAKKKPESSKKPINPIDNGKILSKIQYLFHFPVCYNRIIYI